jgi:hypothetical protein
MIFYAQLQCIFGINSYWPKNTCNYSFNVRIKKTSGEHFFLLKQPQQRGTSLYHLMEGWQSEQIYNANHIIAS